MSWDPRLLQATAAAIASEARGFLDTSLWGVAQNNLGPLPGNYGCLTYWAPTVNLDRDPRWGRTDEAFGEDPYLAAVMAGAYPRWPTNAPSTGSRSGRSGSPDTPPRTAAPSAPRTRRSRPATTGRRPAGPPTTRGTPRRGPTRRPVRGYPARPGDRRGHCAPV